MPAKPRVNCVRCRYFYITWDDHFPKGCKVFGFKSMHDPSLTVLEATGKQCEEFVEKVKRGESKELGV